VNPVHDRIGKQNGRKAILQFDVSLKPAQIFLCLGFLIFTEVIHDTIGMNKYSDLRSLQNAIESMNYYTGVTNVDVCVFFPKFL
jgi:hypothetical protein